MESYFDMPCRLHTADGEEKMDFKKKKVLVFGSGKSGIGAASLLLQTGADPVIYDGNEKADTDAIHKKLREALQAAAQSGSPAASGQKRGCFARIRFRLFWGSFRRTGSGAWIWLL